MSVQPIRDSLPDWPRFMKRARAAAYCDLSEAAFEREIVSGRLPSAIILGGKDHWCRRELDKALDRLTGASDVPDYRKEHEERYGT